jgi:hypothetical protein
MLKVYPFTDDGLYVSPVWVHSLMKIRIAVFGEVDYPENGEGNGCAVAQRPCLFDTSAAMRNSSLASVIRDLV